jgi:hypothetical protein
MCRVLLGGTLALASLAGARARAAAADPFQDDFKTYQGALDTVISCKQKYKANWVDYSQESRTGPPEDSAAFYASCVFPLEKAFAAFVQSLPHKSMDEIEQALGARYMGRYLLAQLATAHAVAGQTNAEGKLPEKSLGDPLLSMQAHEEMELLSRLNKNYPMEKSPAGPVAEGGDAAKSAEQVRLGEVQTTPAELLRALNKVVDDGLYMPGGGGAIADFDTYRIRESQLQHYANKTPEMLKSRANLSRNVYPLKLAHTPTPTSVMFFENESQQRDKLSREIAVLPPMLIRTDLVDELKKRKALNINCGLSQANVYVPQDGHLGLKNGYVVHDPKRGKTISTTQKPETPLNNQPIILKPQKLDAKSPESFDWLLFVTVSANDTTRDRQFQLQKGRRLETVYHAYDLNGLYKVSDYSEGYHTRWCFPREAYADSKDKSLVMYYGVPLSK